MRKCCLVASFLLAMLWVPGLARAAGGEPSGSIEPVLVSRAPGDDSDPTIGVNADGRVFLAWKRLPPSGDAVEIRLAQSPGWAASTVATIPSPQPDMVGLSLGVGERPSLAWSEPATQTTILRSLVPGAIRPREWELPAGDPSTFAIDGRGRLHAVWAQDRAIYYLDSSVDATVTITVETVITGGELSLAPRRTWALALGLAGDDLPHLAWATPALPEQPSAVYYAPLAGQTAPVEVAAGGHSPRLAVGPSGRAHLCWLSEGGLHYASSRDWAESQVVVSASLESSVFAFAVGPAEVAHLAWVQDDALWYANSVDWQCSRVQLSRYEQLSGLDLAVDLNGQPHIAFAVAGAEGTSEVYYVCPAPASPQLSITYPSGGEVLTSDVTVRAQSNLLAGDLLRVEFYLEIGDPSGQFEEVLWSLGLDRDGRDGWDVPLHVADLSSKERYRVLALGIDSEGRIIRATGDWFTIQIESPWVWVEPPQVDASRGKASVAALAGSSGSRLAHLDLFLAPLGYIPRTDILQSACALPPGSVYVGSYDLALRQSWPGTRWGQLVYDSRGVPDGEYTAFAVVTDRLARRDYGCSTAPLSIDNAMAPTVEVIAPVERAVITGTLEAAALATDRDGVVERVDFFVERDRPLLQTRHRGREYALEVADLVWLGGDTDGSDGWSVRVPIGESLDGEGWRVRAVALDNGGLSTSARSSGTFSLVGRDRPALLVLRPSSGSVVSGTQTVELAEVEGLRFLRGLQAYLEDADGALTHLGPMSQAGTRWLSSWDTTAVPDGLYNLLIVGHHLDGRGSLARSENVSVANERSIYQFTVPAPNEVLQGRVLLSLEGPLQAQPAEARFFYQDQAGRLRFIARGSSGQDGWCAVWDTSAALDGDYRLVATVTSPEGRVWRAERLVRVRNVTPSIAFHSSEGPRRWRGTREITWVAEHPLGEPMSVTVEYSPDGGARWIELATDIPSDESFLWDTEGYPDSSQGVLRLTVTDGVHTRQTTSGPFVLNNVNEPPQVALLAPQSDSVHGGQVRIAWQAWDPDDDSLAVELDYRRGSGPWRSLAQGVPKAGHYLWDAGQLVPGGDYEVRVTAIDLSKAAGTDLAHGIRLVSNSPPEVHLLAPRGGGHFDQETVILWRADDGDGDELLIDLYYSDNAGQVWLPMVEGAPNTGYYVWQVSYLPVGSQYRVRVTARDGLFQVSDESDRIFSVGASPRPEVRLLSPTPGDDLSGMQLVEWWATSSGRGPLQVSLMVRASSSEDWDLLLDNVPDDGFYLWNTRGHADGRYELRIVVTDGRSSAEDLLGSTVRISNRGNHPPQVVLLSPKGGELWVGTQEVLWRAWDRDGDPITATLYVSVDGGREWDRLASLDARAGAYLWDTSLTPSSQRGLVAIAVTDGAATARDASQGVLRLANRQSSPPYALFTSPDASGRLLRGNAVAWIAEDVDGDPLSIYLSLSDDGGLTWRDLAGALPDAGEYVLDTTLLRAGASNRLRLQVSDGLYRVEALSAALEPATPPQEPPELRIETPSGGERWSGVQRVHWRASDPTGQSVRVDLELSHDGGRHWATLAAAYPNVGGYSWDTSQAANGVYRLRLTADNGQAKAVRTSEPFVVDNAGRNAPVVSLISPRGGEVWEGTREVSWRALDPDGDALRIDLSYSLDVGTTWHTIARSIPDAGSYVWDTTSMPNCDLVWLRATVSDGQQATEDLSDGYFSVRNPHAPVAALLAPTGGEWWAGTQDIVWHVAHDPDRPVRVTLQVSLDQGRTWRTLARDRPARGSYAWDTAGVPDNTPVLVRLRATDGLQSALATVTEPVIIVGNAPLPSSPFRVP